jgi:hypothetical protein
VSEDISKTRVPYYIIFSTHNAFTNYLECVV